MADWSQIEGAECAAVGVVAASMRGTNVTASATINTKGVWDELIASSAQDYDAVWITSTRHSLANADYMIDIGVGAAASEVVVIANILTSNAGSGVANGPFAHFPITIPAGTRISGRCQCTTASGVMRVSLVALSPQPSYSGSLSRVTTYGANTADSGGTSIDPGATLNTKGAWVELTASATSAVAAVLLSFGAQINTARNLCTWLFDIGVGAAGSEVVIVPNVLVQNAALDDMPAPNYTPCVMVSIPAATRIAVRAQCSITDASDRLLDVVMYAIS